MELATILTTVKDRAWLVGAVVTVAVLALAASTLLNPPEYQARVKLQFSAPPQQEVALFEPYRTGNARDEAAIARNTFAELLRSGEPRARTVKALNLQGGAARYDVVATVERESDFLTVTVEAPTPEQAARIVNTHVEETIKYLGEARAKPALAAKTALTEQVRAATGQVKTAEQALVDFQRQNNIGDLDKEIAGYQTSIQELRVERSRRAAANNTPATLRDVEAVLEQMTAERDRLTQLVPAHNALKEDARQARANLQMLQEKLSEASLKADGMLSTSFVQVLAPAMAADARADGLSLATVLLALAGSLGIGVILALLSGLGPWPARIPRFRKSGLSAEGTRGGYNHPPGRDGRPSEGLLSWVTRQIDPQDRS